MEIIKVFYDSGKRKYAIIRIGRLTCLAWRSLRRKEWLAAPFAVEIANLYWIAKSQYTHTTPKLATEFAKQLERTKGQILDTQEIKKILAENRLLKKSRKAEQSLQEFKKHYGVDKIQWKKIQKIISISLTGAAYDEYFFEIHRFDPKFSTIQEAFLKRKKKPAVKKPRKPKTRQKPRRRIH